MGARRVLVALSVLLLSVVIASVAAASSRVYQRPTKSRGGALQACPSLSGVQAFSPSAIRAARGEVRRFGRVSLAYDLSVSDPAWRPNVRAAWSGKHSGLPGHGPEFVLGPDSKSPYADIVAHSCGQGVLSHTTTFVAVPGSHHKSNPLGCVACRTTFFMIDRSGRPLIYFEY